MFLRSLVALSACATLAVALHAQPPKPKFATASQKWNAQGGGVLFDGVCLDADKDVVTVLAFAKGQLKVPIELFSKQHQDQIRKHFGITGAAKVLAKVKPPTRAEMKPFKSELGGGTMVTGKVVGRTDQFIEIADEKGSKYRVPFDLLDGGSRELARTAITKLEGKPFNPTEGGVASKPPTPPSGFPMPPGNPPTLPGIPSPPGSGEPKGEMRTWTMRGGKLSWKGQFVEIRQGTLYIRKPDGSKDQVPYDLLEEADKQYADVLAKGGKGGEAPKGALVVSSREAQLVADASGKSRFLVDGKTLHVLDESGQPTGIKHTLAVAYTVMRERDEYWVAAAGKELHFLDKKSFQPTAKHELWKFQRILDIALHPTRKLAVVSVEHTIDFIRKNTADRQKIVLVDETNGKVRDPEDAHGGWVRMHPSGSYVLAGFHDWYKSGPDREIAPNGQILPRINTEHIDTLYRYKLEGFELKRDEQVRNAGTNGQGLVLSPDGGRVAYLSFTGSPQLSYNVVAFDALDFDKKPVTFAMANKADCKRLVFNSAGTLAASPQNGGAAIFDVRTGAEIPGRIATDPDLAGAAIHDLAFSADGRHLIFVASRAGSPRYLKVAALTKE